MTVLDILEVNRISSNKSNIGSTTNQILYTGVKPDWQYPDLHHWLNIFDQLYHWSYLNNWSNNKHGAFVYIWIRFQKVHKKIYTPLYLPINVYNP